MVGKLIKVGIVGLVAGGGYAAYWYWRRVALAQAKAATISEEAPSKQHPRIEVGQVWTWAADGRHPQIGEVMYFVVNDFGDGEDWLTVHVTQLGALSEVGGKARYTRLKRNLELSLGDIYLLYALVPDAEVMPSK